MAKNTSNLLYFYNKCSTCRKAVALLEKKNIAYSLKDLSTSSPSIIELKVMLKHYQGNLRKLFNTSGVVYRELKISEKLDRMSEAEALQLLSENGMLVKRPFFLAPDFGLVGFDEKLWLEKIKSL